MQDRSSYLGGTDANRIAHGRMREVWLEKTGRAERADLSEVLRVQLGLFTEPFNLRWFEQRTGFKIIAPKAETLYRHPTLEFLACHPDGFYTVEGERHIIDAKHTGSGTVEEKLAYYQGQLTHNMLATGLSRATLSILFGNSGWAFGTIGLDRAFAGELIAREQDLWIAIQNDAEPDDLPPIGQPDKLDIVMREVDMTGSNSWSVAALDFIDDAPAAKRHADAKAALRELMQDDMRRAFGHGVEAVRNRAGAVTVRPIKEKKPNAGKAA